MAETQISTADGWVRHGIGAYNRSEPLEASRAFARAIEIDPHHCDALNLLGVMRLESGEPLAAIALIEQALQYFPQNSNASGRIPILINLGNGLQTVGRLELAESHYLEALALASGNTILESQLFNNLANIYDRQNRVPEALDSYRRALKLHSDNPEAAANFAHFLQRVSLHEEAISWFEAAIRLAPRKLVGYSLAMAESHFALGDYGSGLGLLRRLTLEAPIAASFIAYGEAIQRYPNHDLTKEMAGNAPESQNESQTESMTNAFTHRVAKLREGFDWIVRGCLIAKLAPTADMVQALAAGQLAVGELAAARSSLSEAELRAKTEFNFNNSDSRSTGVSDSESVRLAIKLYFLRGRLEELSEDYPAAIAAYRQVLSLDREPWAARVNLANCLAAISRSEASHLPEADSLFRSLLSERPNDIAAQLGLATVLHQGGDSAAAITQLDAAIIDAPQVPQLRFNRANILQDSGDFPCAISAFRELLVDYPDYIEAKWNLAFAELASGDYINGFQNFEVRWQRPSGKASERKFTAPLWHGETLAGKRLLVHGEQGLGDSLQFCRYLPLILAQFSPVEIICEVQPPLVGLLQQSFPQITVVARVAAYPYGDDLPPFDCHIATMSLPRIFATTVETVPQTVPGRVTGQRGYLQVPEAERQKWAAKLASAGRVSVGDSDFRTIGIVWAGECRREVPLAVETDRRRSIALQSFAPLAQRAAELGARLVSLQLGPPRDQIKSVSFSAEIVDLMGEVRDFADSAALIANLDLVVAVDTSVAHAAAALGVRTLLLSRHNGCWRWLVGRSDSPWYPSLTVVQQQKPYKWEDEIAQVCRLLHFPLQ